jgi:hypothetical protein
MESANAESAMTEEASQALKMISQLYIKAQRMSHDQ